MTREPTNRSLFRLLQVKHRLATLRSEKGCRNYIELVNGIRTDVDSGLFTYAQIGVTEIELLELGLNNARLNCVNRSDNILATQRIVQLYLKELARLKKSSRSTTVRVA